MHLIQTNGEPRRANRNGHQLACARTLHRADAPSHVLHQWPDATACTHVKMRNRSIFCKFAPIPQTFGLKPCVETESRHIDSQAETEVGGGCPGNLVWLGSTKCTTLVQRPGPPSLRTTHPAP